MKTGYYLRFVPTMGEFCFYFFDGSRLFYLGEHELFSLGWNESNYIIKRTSKDCVGWHASLQKEPNNEFEFICNEMLEEF